MSSRSKPPANHRQVQIHQSTWRSPATPPGWHNATPGQKETHHLFQMLRHESNSGQLDDLSHIASEYCLADRLTKSSAKPDQLVKTIETGVMENVDVHPPFRSLLLSQWVADHMHDARHGLAFMNEDINFH